VRRVQNIPYWFGLTGLETDFGVSRANTKDDDDGPSRGREREGGKAHRSHAFVSVRPPGHHCGEDTPCGFCFVNNVMVGAAHGKRFPVDSLWSIPTYGSLNESDFGIFV